ncbi:hypothetical protein REPUB_Repub13aG0167500 [Reevesia pubescens]
MAGTSQLIQQIESFVDSSPSPSQQAASLDAIASLLKNNQLTIETLVREMEGYLTTSDDTIRARGILLLGEVLAHLASKPLDDAAIHSLIGFFTDRLADWRALRGALVGCLALLRRKNSVGMVCGTDAKAVAESYLQNLQVQSLGQYERKLCFELLECLLERYPNAVASLGDDIICGLCEAVDGEKDPHCLMLTFHIIEVLSRLFPDPCGSLTSFAHDLSEILGCYFPIHFTHPKGEVASIKRDDLARALMLAFSSTPLFEPFSIPLLLEKLSSSLPSAKATGMSLEMSNLLDAKYACLQVDSLSVLSFTPESLEGLGFRENEIAAEALGLLQKLIVQNTKLLLDLLVACRDLIASSETIIALSAHTEETWNHLLQRFLPSLTKAFCSAFICTGEDAHDADMYFGVNGLLILANFPGSYLLISKTVFEKIGPFIERFHESEKEQSFMAIVVERMVSLAFPGDFSIPLRLQALSDVGTSGQSYMLKVVQGLEEAIYANLFEVYVHGSTNSGETVTQLLKCYSDKVIPWILCAKGFEEVLLQFAINIWNQIENNMVFNAIQTDKRGVLDVMMKAMKLAVASCSEENQNIIVQKRYYILSLSTSFPLKKLSQHERFQIVQEVDNSSSRDEWILSLFAAVIIAVHPQIHIPNIRPILYLFMTTLLKGNVAAAQALGSMVNKLGLTSTGVQTSSDCTLEEAMDIILNSSLWIFHSNSSSDIQAKMTGVHDIGLINLSNVVGSSTSLQIHAIVGLAWIGKGLLMRGHEKVKDIIVIFLRCLQSSERADPLYQEKGILENNDELNLHHFVMRSAGDAFQILTGDSELCLNWEFHAVIQPLYKQRFFSTMMPILWSLIMKSEPFFNKMCSDIRRGMLIDGKRYLFSVSTNSETLKRQIIVANSDAFNFLRPFLFRASAHIIIDTPLIVVLSDAKKVKKLFLIVHILSSIVSLNLFSTLMMVIETLSRRISIFVYFSSCALKYRLLFYEIAFYLGSISLRPLQHATPSQPKEKGKKPTTTIISYPPIITALLFICKFGLLCLLQLSQLLSLLDYMVIQLGDLSVPSPTCHPFSPNPKKREKSQQQPSFRTHLT